MYKLRPTKYFARKYKQYKKRDSQLISQIRITTKELRTNPFSSSLFTHKVNTSKFGITWSSRVTGDIRIIWDFDGDEINVIDLFDVGGHSGSKKVYK